jgi:2-polyprenyl-3-methyl-5-hydroxy-6-metoxy-1,4-benzoquinol methylase
VINLTKTENAITCRLGGHLQNGSGQTQQCLKADDELFRYEKAKARIVVRNLTSYLGLSLRDKKILEIGCSTGALMEELEKRGADVSGVDVDSSWSCRYYYSPEKRILLDIQENNFPDEWEKKDFDLVIAQEVIEHIKRPYDFLRRVWRVLKPDGWLFLTTPNLTGITALLKGRKWCGLVTESHFLLYSPKSMDFTVCNCGFRKVRTFTNTVPIVYQDKYPSLWRLNRAFMPLGMGGGIMGLYRKTEHSSTMT